MTATLTNEQPGIDAQWFDASGDGSQHAGIGREYRDHGPLESALTTVTGSAGRP
jgi:hypothetical protein